MWNWNWSRRDAVAPCSTITLAELREGWRRVRRGSDASGVDGIRGNRAEEDLETLLPDLAADLSRGTYAPLPFRTTAIPKPGGGERVLHIPCVRDRVVQQVLAQRLTRRCDPLLQPICWAYRPARGREGAVRNLLAVARRGALDWVARVDIRAFFDSIDHDRLLAALAKRAVPEEETRLIRLTLAAGILDGPRVVRPRLGCPQGSPLSPVLSNIYLDDLDRWLGSRYAGNCRYADDIAIPCASEGAARDAIESVRRQLARLELTTHPEKTKVVHLHHLEFLGYRFDILQALDHDDSPGFLRSMFRYARRLVGSRR